jgi:choice-of-anchor A domain-containing protein
MLRPKPVWLLAFVLLACSAVQVRAGYVTNTLASAGPSSFGILSIANNTLVQLNGVTTAGNVGISGAGDLQLNTGSTVNGNVYLGNAAVIQHPSQVLGTIFVNQFSKLSKADADAVNASNAFAALSPTLTVPGGQITGSMTLTGTAGVNVLNLTNISLGAGNTLTLDGPAGAQWVINDSGGLTLTQAGIVETGGSTASDVVFNIRSTVTVSEAGLTNSQSVINGVVLAPNSNVQLSSGVINGELISGGTSVQISAGASVNEAAPATPVTPTPSSLVLMSLGGIAFIGLMIRVGRQQPFPA